MCVLTNLSISHWLAAHTAPQRTAFLSMTHGLNAEMPMGYGYLIIVTQGPFWLQIRHSLLYPERTGIMICRYQ
ncbi:hypothetical protein ACKLNR_008708 [Fusarium oxysporum f. sp. zingiberi]